LPTTEAPVWAVRAGRGSEYEGALLFGGDVINGWAGSRDDLEGDSSSSRLFLDFCDDFRGGGLGGSGDSLFFFFLSLSLRSASRTVEFDDEDVKDDSLTTDKALESALTRSASFDMLSVLLRVIGGLVRAESTCLIRLPAVGIRTGATRPGDCDEIEVGVVSRLYGPGPGEPEKRVDGLPLKPLI
jgi:hypothetical protein